MRIGYFLRWTLDALNLRYDADISGIPAPDSGKPTRRTTTRTIVDRPDNVKPDQVDGRSWEFDERPDGQDWERWTTGGNRSGQMTEADQKACQDNKLDLVKYSIIKAAWATKGANQQYLSAKTASQRLGTDVGHGYGQRTVEKYYSVINRVNNHSPATAA